MTELLSQQRSSAGEGLVAALIGDVVRSRAVEDRRTLHRELMTALGVVNGMVPALQPPDVTVGDEFQGTYPSVAAALDASLLIRLHLLPYADTRYGIGWGALTVLEPSRQPMVQDGPAWWAARQAVDQIPRAGTRRGLPRAMATAVVLAQGTETGDAINGERAVNAYLACRDHLVDRLDARGARLLLGLYSGLTHEQMAANEGISRPAVTQRIAGGGVQTIWASRELLTGTAAWFQE